MGFIKGALVAIPIALYFGQRNLGFPLRFRLDRNKQETQIVFQYKFVNTLIKDLGSLVGAKNQ